MPGGGREGIRAGRRSIDIKIVRAAIVTRALAARVGSSLPLQNTDSERRRLDSSTSDQIRLRDTSILRYRLRSGRNTAHGGFSRPFNESRYQNQILVKLDPGTRTLAEHSPRAGW